MKSCYYDYSQYLSFVKRSNTLQGSVITSSRYELYFPVIKYISLTNLLCSANFPLEASSWRGRSGRGCSKIQD